MENMYNQAKLALNIVIVGCGVGGTSAALAFARAGHKVTVLEAADVIGERVGAGLQLTPNITKLLVRWGLEEELLKVIVNPTRFVWRRYSDGEALGALDPTDMIKENGAAFYQIHRGDLFNLIYSLLPPDNVTVRRNAPVVKVVPASDSQGSPSVVLASGEALTADLIIGADGVKSVTRPIVQPELKNQGAAQTFRMLLSAELLSADPLLKSLVDEPQMTNWLGPYHNIVGYLVSSKRLYNMAWCWETPPDDRFLDLPWSRPCEMADIHEEFKNWEPRLRKLLTLVPKGSLWKLWDHDPLETWTDSTGGITLLGDACHAMMPHGGQGAAMAIEDGIVLGSLFARISHRDQIKPLLHAYEELRKSRCSNTQRASRQNGYKFHLVDGAEQQQRDALISETLDTSKPTCTWAELLRQRAQFGYDSEEAAKQWLDAHEAELTVAADP